ncbi:flavin monoamine oxidase family protein [Dictyobacter aurantiacus]|uniref:Amine oxidase domain-containing protein n=1 Tax=Dictyobacter aurantiacus TaxID=1936993 RepID=A0A401ZSN0_9CHLR|nr:NAD(P)/FAD-dependent oxidoreductase [Dictyobacter aurantiacus]GCE09790.1 hypothetical protein KDAU_71190 [Dictyobacter aurantiacus]
MPRIAIVGAGIAGLNAALTLQDANLACDIYEAADHVGGRMHSDTTTWADGMVSELCGEFIDGDHETIHRLIKRFNLQTVDLWQAGQDRTQNLMYFFNRYYSSEEMDRDFQALAPLLQQQVLEADFPTTYNHFTETGARLDQMSVYEWIETYIEGGHNTPLGHMLDGACTGFYGLDSNVQSSLNLVYMFGPRDLVEEPATPTSVPDTTKIVGGNARLPQAIAHSLPDKCIHLQHQLTSIERMEDGTLNLIFTTVDGSKQIQCDHVILTLPFSTLRHIDYQRAGFDPLKQTAIEEIGYGTISKLFLQFDRPYWFDNGPWPQLHRGFIITDLDVQTFWDTSLGQPGSSGLLVNYTSGHRGAAYAPETSYATSQDSTIIQGYAQHCLQQLEKVFPGITPHYIERAALSYPTGDPYLRGSYSCWRIGQYTRFAGYEGVRQGSIHFAGEHCSVDFQGYMEGGAREGERAAHEIIDDFNQPK